MSAPASGVDSAPGEHLGSPQHIDHFLALTLTSKVISDPKIMSEFALVSMLCSEWARRVQRSISVGRNCYSGVQRSREMPEIIRNVNLSPDHLSLLLMNLEVGARNDSLHANEVNEMVLHSPDDETKVSKQCLLQWTPCFDDAGN